MRNILKLFAAIAVLAIALPGAALAVDDGHGTEIEAQDWSFAPPFGHFDRAQLQRGYKVYQFVCANCHGMTLLSYRNLGEPGGPQFSEAAVEALASQAQITDGPDDTGKMFQRPGKPSDRFRSPYPNDQASRAANGGALPPDLSVMAKAREGGPDYLYALMTGYGEVPEEMKMTKGMHYNAAFPGHQIAMPNPLSEGVVEYTDGTEPTVKNYAKDVSAFMMWAAEPKLEERYKIGARIMIFLIVFAVIMYLSKIAVWSRVHKKDHAAKTET
ncbi:MAG: cytochrome c1 [Chromatiales bacterium]|nr:cytochrome c1 [Chromatiales bacterium]